MGASQIAEVDVGKVRFNFLVGGELTAHTLVDETAMLSRQVAGGEVASGVRQAM